MDGEIGPSHGLAGVPGLPVRAGASVEPAELGINVYLPAVESFLVES